MDEKGLFLTQLDQDPLILDSLGSRPNHYPEPEMYANRLFYIQRNQNSNAVIYEANLLAGGLLNLDEPISIHWIQFDPATGEEKIQSLNHIQKKLAYGYHFDVVHPDLIRFKFVSYDDLVFYLVRANNGTYKVATDIAGQSAYLNSIYIYAEDLGVFPQVRFAELFGSSRNEGKPLYQKIILNL